MGLSQIYFLSHSSATYIKQFRFAYSMDRRKIQYVIADLDGTLLNNREPCYFAVKKTLQHFGLGSNFFQDDYRAIWGCNLELFWKKAGIPGSMPFEEIDRVFWEIFPAFPHTEPFEGTGKALYEMACRGISFALLTAAKQHDIEAFHNLPAYNSSTMYDMFAYTHPRCTAGKGEAIAEIMQRLGAKPENTALVDDSPSAITAARELGLLAIGMLDGHASEERVRAAEPHHEIRLPSDLVGIINYS
jgi:phosphoglycolate phosphatase-like HAD superfamily hydrolase